MELNIDFVAYMWIIGTLLVLVGVAGCFVVVASFRRHDRRREETMAGSARHYPWDIDHPDSFGHR